MSKLIGRNLLGAVAAACLFVSGATQGVVFRGTFDPPIYVGDVLVDVDPACVSLLTEWIEAGSGGCGPVDILELIVNNHPSQPVDQLTFAPPLISDEVWGLWWVGGVLTAIDSFLIRPQASGPTTCDTFVPCEGTFAIEFVSNQDPESSGDDPSIVNLYNCLDSSCEERSLVGDEPATQRVFEQVPEPESLALVLGALGAGWLTRRRKAKA